MKITVAPTTHTVGDVVTDRATGEMYLVVTDERDWKLLSLVRHSGRLWPYPTIGEQFLIYLGKAKEIIVEPQGS